jgi:hypothetical protein
VNFLQAFLKILAARRGLRQEAHRRGIGGGACMVDGAWFPMKDDEEDAKIPPGIVMPMQWFPWEGWPYPLVN